MFDEIAVLVRALRFVRDDLSWLIENAAVYGGVDLTELAVTPAQHALALPPLLATLLVIKLARLWIPAPQSSAIQTLYDVITSRPFGLARRCHRGPKAFATITGWPRPDIAAFAGKLPSPFPATIRNPPPTTLSGPSKRWHGRSATGAQLVGWAAVPTDESTAEGLASRALGVVKAQQSGEDAWLALAPTLMNPIRDHRSAALKAFWSATATLPGALSTATPTDSSTTS